MKHTHVKKIKISIFIIIVLVMPMLLNSQVTSSSSPYLQVTETPIIPSNPTNVVIRETAQYNAPTSDDDPISYLTGVIYWEELAGTRLSFFVNTSKVINAVFKDFETKTEIPQYDEAGDMPVAANSAAILIKPDRYIIGPSSRSFQYEIEAYYEPDIVEDTGFIVVFNSQSVDFSIEIDGQPAFARTDYYNRITLPQGAGIVSYAPIDNGFNTPIGKTDDGRWVLEWEYLNREMDTKHDPLMISVTYTYDEIFLAFTEQVYQNQIEQQKQQEEINRLNLLKQSFEIIATFAILASLFSILFAYLLARRKFETDLNTAKELPKREIVDIEKSPPQNLPVRSMFLSIMIIIPLILNPIPLTDAQLIDNDNILWNGTYDLNNDLTLTEYVDIELPIEKENIYIYTNTSEASLRFYDDLGSELQFDTEDNRFIIPNPGLKFNYELERPYQVHNNSGMLVWLDRFWLEFRNPEATSLENEYFKVDLNYNVLLPRNAILYSASPSELLEISNIDGRTNVNMRDQSRQMDAFHDVFETQVTFSFLNIIDALENLDSDFVQLKPEEQNIESLLLVAADEVLIFSLIGLIAPILSFFLAYWILRKRYKKLIDRIEKQQEEQLFVEAPQISAFTAAITKTEEHLSKAFKGHIYRLNMYLSKILETDISKLNDIQLLSLIKKSKVKIDYNIYQEIKDLEKSMIFNDEMDQTTVRLIFDLVNDLIKSHQMEDQK